MCGHSFRIGRKEFEGSPSAFLLSSLVSELSELASAVDMCFISHVYCGSLVLGILAFLSTLHVNVCFSLRSPPRRLFALRLPFSFVSDCLYLSFVASSTYVCLCNHHGEATSSTFRVTFSSLCLYGSYFCTGSKCHA